MSTHNVWMLDISTNSKVIPRYKYVGFMKQILLKLNRAKRCAHIWAGRNATLDSNRAKPALQVQDINS